MISIGVQAARNYIKKGFDEGNASLDRYINGPTPFLRSGHVVCELELNQYFITLNMKVKDAVRTGKSQAQQDKLKEANVQIFGE